jgi:thioester reductase-like protein
VSTVVRCPQTHVSEALHDLTWAQSMGYAQSKLVAKHVCTRAADLRILGVPTRVLRVGQIIADARFGIWNTTEAVPLMLQPASTVSALPRLRKQPSWLPVDTVAQAMVEVSLANRARADIADTAVDTAAVNIANRRSFDWTADLLPALHRAGVAFDEVTLQEWV